jgi:hypothetical protein
MSNSFATNVQSPQGYQNIGGQATSAGNSLSNINYLSDTFAQYPNQILPGAQQTATNLYNNPYAGSYQQGAGQAAGLGAGAAYTGYNSGQQLSGAGNSLLPYATNILNQSQNPQNALYNQMYAQNQNQANAQNAMSGIAGTPYGAGVTNQADQNFNLNWQNFLLGQEATGANAASGLVGAAGQAGTTGSNLMGNAANTLASSAALPYATYSTIGGGQDSALSSLLGLASSSENVANTPTQDYLSYFNSMNSANQTANQLYGQQLQQSNLGFNQLGSMLGGGLGLGTSIYSMIPGS